MFVSGIHSRQSLVILKTNRSFELHEWYLWYKRLMIFYAKLSPLVHSYWIQSHQDQLHNCKEEREKKKKKCSQCLIFVNVYLCCSAGLGLSMHDTVSSLLSTVERCGDFLLERNICWDIIINISFIFQVHTFDCITIGNVLNGKWYNSSDVVYKKSTGAVSYFFSWHNSCIHQKW